MSSSQHGSDMKAAFVGLIVGAIAILLILTTIVHLTNSKYEHEAPAPAAHG